jgi:hypothetical protein
MGIFPAANSEPCFSDFVSQSRKIMNTKCSEPQTKGFIHSATRWIYLLMGLLVLCGFAASEAQGQKIKVDVNVACADSDSGVNDAQVYFNGILVDLSNPPRGTDRIELTPGTYLIKASLKSFPGAVIKDIYSSGPDDTYPRKYEPASLGDGISLALDRQARPGSAIAYSMRIDMTRCVPGTAGPPATPTPTSSAPTQPSTEVVRVVEPEKNKPWCQGEMQYFVETTQKPKDVPEDRVMVLYEGGGLVSGGKEVAHYPLALPIQVAQETQVHVPEGEWRAEVNLPGWRSVLGLYETWFTFPCKRDPTKREQLEQDIELAGGLYEWIKAGFPTPTSDQITYRWLSQFEHLSIKDYVDDEPSQPPPDSVVKKSAPNAAAISHHRRAASGPLGDSHFTVEVRGNQGTKISVIEGALKITPENSRPFILRAGQQVQVTGKRVGSITPISGRFGGPSQRRAEPSIGIGGVWTAPSGDTFSLTLSPDGRTVTGTYRGVLGAGSISGAFNGRHFTGAVQIGEGLSAGSLSLTLSLTGDNHLEGRIDSMILSAPLILSRSRR